MYSYLKKIAQHSAIYAIGNLALLIPGFVLIPLYTRYLSPSEYGAANLVLLFSGVLMMFYESGMVGALSRQYFEYSDEEASRRRTVATTAFLFILCVSIILSIPVYFAAKHISIAITSTGMYADLIRIMAISTFLGSVAIIPQTLMRLEQRSFTYIAISVTLMVFSIIMNLAFFTVFKCGINSIFYANVAIALLGTSLFMIFTFRNFVALKFSYPDLKGMLKLTVLFLPAALMSWMIDYSGRYILEKMASLHDVGIYSLGYKIAQVMALLIKAFIVAWFPIIFSIIEDERSHEIFSKIFTYFVFVFALFALAISVFGREIIRIFASGEYSDAYRVMPFITVSYLLFGIYQFFSYFLVIKRRYETQPVLLMIVAIANIGLNIVLIPKLGMIGCAVTILVSYVILSYVSFRFSQRHYRIPVEAGRLLKLILPFLAVMAAGSYANIDNLFIAIVFKTFLVALYVVLLYGLGFFRKEEILKIKDLLRKGKRVFVEAF